ncbi:autophagy-related protein 2 homolog B-like isoform X2 [Centruroides sculpturatus]|uniref:autophagy-related protein 2 homolog B-like isoform X2 n=1 Tax=Centruroides sculpturatus TaxID=218467 RepID=UPI000C6D5357|nr:autophagy-related protein 2 homolog B-like isoform X2 [Centruroides sculpturatus]
MASPIIIEGNEKSSSLQWLLSSVITIADAEIVECLFNDKTESKDNVSSQPQYSEILCFSVNSLRSAGSNVPNWNEPSIRIKYHGTERTSQMRNLKQPNNSINLQLGPFYSEVDISILDRIHTLLRLQSFSTLHEKYDASPNAQSWTDKEQTTTGKTDIVLNSPFILLCFRFPIPDLRPLHNMDRAPWWQRNLRKDLLLLELTGATLTSTLDIDETSYKCEIQCRDAHGLFQSGLDETPVSFLRTCADSNSDGCTKDDGFDWPRLVFKANPISQHSVLEAEILPENDESLQMNSIMCHMDLGESLPFVSRRVFYETDLHSNVNGRDKQENSSSCEADQVIMPADKYQVQEFVEKAMNNTRYSLEFLLPNLNIFLPSKHFYEELYNRLATDLVMWELSAPKAVNRSENFNGRGSCSGFDLASQLTQETSCFQTFSMCKSALQYESSSDSEEGNGLYYSISEPFQRGKKKHFKRQDQIQNLQSNLVITVNVTQGKTTLIAPLRDNSANVVPGQYGEFQLHVEDSLFCFVSNYHGELHNNYVCLQSNKATFYHNGMLSTIRQPQKLEPAVLIPPTHLHATIYQSDPGIPQKQGFHVGKGGDSLDMLSVVIKVNLDEQAIKTFKVAVGISGATLRHYTTTSPQNWLTQFVDFFDIVDYPVNGYIPPAIITELHLHLWSCAIDYRPLHLPLRAVITMENFSISSNIAANTTTSVFRIIAEELCLLISNNTEAEKVDLKKNYVCVVDTGLFDLSLRMTDNKDSSHPKLDLRAMNNMVHIRTCADSCRALQNLITYFANDGDLLSDTSLLKGTEVPILITESDGHGIINLSKSQVAQVNDLMAEAMKESSNGCSCCLRFSTDDNGNKEFHSEMDHFGTDSPTNEFHSPNLSQENTVTLQTEIDRYNEDIMASDDETMDEPSADDEFCILENDPGIGITPKSGEPQVRVLTTEPLRLIENHFSVPLGKMDELRSPKNFPPPVLRYILREMSIVWHMYGGHDFDVPKVKNEKGKEKHVTLQDDKRDRYESSTESRLYGPVLHLQPQGVSVGFTKIGEEDSIWTNVLASPKVSTKNNIPKSWLMRGGVGRMHDVVMELQMNKVRFQHEVYPEKTEQASRQVLIIHDVEIRDRLASSKINKFLYQYASQAMPRQSHANMVVIKAVHIRPDPNLLTQECSLKVSLKPLRLNVDQDALLFLYNFFTEVCDISSESNTETSTTPHHSPVMGVTSPTSSGLTPTEPDRLLIMLQERTEETQDLISPLQENANNDGKSNISSNKSFTTPIFFRSFEFTPDVPIKLDYHGKRVDMEQGALAGILMGLGQLNNSELKLKRLSYRHGLLGIDKLLAYILNEWLTDIRRNQLPSVLVGVGPMHSVVQLIQGIRDLFWLPIEQYRKDGRIVRGIQRGANSFTTSTAMACLELANRLVQTIQGAAEFTYDMVSPGPSVRIKNQIANRKWHSSSQPADIREGMATAYQVVREGLGDTARNFVKIASEEHEHKGVSGAVGGVLRQIPPTVVKPIILATEATSTVLGGVRNQLVPDARREAVEKWRCEQRH